MTAESTLKAVRDISENAYRRAATKFLRLTRAQDLAAGPRTAIVAYEDTFLPRIGGTNRPHQSGPRRRIEREHVTRPAMEKDFMAAALEKTAA